jgi:hypothetical protein
LTCCSKKFQNADLARQFHLFTRKRRRFAIQVHQHIHTLDSSDQVVQAHRPTFISMTEKGDIEAYPDVVNDPQDETINNETIKERSLRVLSRTKSAATWKDPGPPPDGGALAWTQALSGHLVVLITW